MKEEEGGVQMGGGGDTDALSAPERQRADIRADIRLRQMMSESGTD